MIADRKILKPNSETRPDLHLCSTGNPVRTCPMHAAVSISAIYDYYAAVTITRISTQTRHKTQCGHEEGGRDKMEQGGIVKDHD